MGKAPIENWLEAALLGTGMPPNAWTNVADRMPLKLPPAPLPKPPNDMFRRCGDATPRASPRAMLNPACRAQTVASGSPDATVEHQQHAQRLAWEAEEELKKRSGALSTSHMHSFAADMSVASRSIPPPHRRGRHTLGVTATRMSSALACQRLMESLLLPEEFAYQVVSMARDDAAASDWLVQLGHCITRLGSTMFDLRRRTEAAMASGNRQALQERVMRLMARASALDDALSALRAEAEAAMRQLSAECAQMLVDADAEARRRANARLSWSRAAARMMVLSRRETRKLCALGAALEAMPRTLANQRCDTDDLAATADELCKEVVALLGCAEVTLYVQKKASPMHKAELHRLLRHNEEAQGDAITKLFTAPTSLAPFESLVGEAVSKNELVCTDDAAADERYEADADRLPDCPPPAAMLVLPLADVYAGQVCGAIRCCRPRGGSFSFAQQSLLRKAAPLLALALRSVLKANELRSDRALARALRKTQALIAPGSGLSKDLEMGVFAWATQFTELTGAERCTMFMYDDKQEVLRSFFALELEIDPVELKVDTVRCEGEGEQPVIDLAHPHAHTIAVAGFSALTNESVLMVDAQQDPRFDLEADRRCGYTTRTLLTMPFCSGITGKLLGVVQLQNRLRPPNASFGEADRELLVPVLSLTALHLENLKLHNAP